MHRHARGTARVAAHFPGCRRGPDDFYPARREEPARAHLRSSRTLCRGSHAGVPRERHRARGAEACGAGASDRGSLCAQTSDALSTRRRDPDIPGVWHHDRADGGRYREAPGGEPPPCVDIPKDRRDCRTGMRAKWAKSRQGAWPDDRAIKEVHAEIPSTTAIDLVCESSMDCVISETEPGTTGRM